jgi:hypothetical protein
VGQKELLWVKRARESKHDGNASSIVGLGGEHENVMVPADLALLDLKARNTSTVTKGGIISFQSGYSIQTLGPDHIS